MNHREKKMFAEALFCQLYAGLLVKIFPFRKIPRLFKNPRLPGREDNVTAAGEIKRAIQRSSRFSPWKNRCLVQSLAARHMLAARGIVSQLSLGMNYDNSKKMRAHAWLKTGDCEVVEKNGDFVELYFF